MVRAPSFVLMLRRGSPFWRRRLSMTHENHQPRRPPQNTRFPPPATPSRPPLWRRAGHRLFADRGPRKPRLWVFFAVPLISLALIAGIAVVAAYAYFAKGLPSIDWARHYRPPIVTNVVSGDQQVMGEFYDERRVVVAYERVPKKLVQAFIASEDADFFDHGGVSLTGLLRGLYQTYVKRTRIVGGSTLSQQTAKAIIASSEGAKAVRVRSGWAGVRRKVREFILTRRLESNFNKEQILNLYLNEVYLGHHAYGVQAAAENYFRKNVWELTLPEMALIAGLPQAPSAYSPFAHPDKAKARRGYVLRRMFEEGMIGAKQRDAADASPSEVYPVQDIFRETAPYVTEHVRRDVVARYGNQRLLQDGLQIFTTVDLEREHDAIAATLKGILDVDKRQGFRGALMHLPEKDWADFAQKEEKFLRGDGSKDEVVAALVTKVEKEQISVTVGEAKGVVQLAATWWARKPNSELNSEYSKISTLK